MTLALIDGEWTGSLVRRWTPGSELPPTPAELATLRPLRRKQGGNYSRLLACPTCHARLTETCRTTGGNPTADHAERLVSRRCPCGAPVAAKKRYCEPCRLAARRRTYRDREIRKATALRRKGAA